MTYRGKVKQFDMKVPFGRPLISRVDYLSTKVDKEMVFVNEPQEQIDDSMFMQVHGTSKC